MTSQHLVKKRIAFSLLLLLFLQLYAIPYTLYPVRAVDSTPSANVQSKLEILKAQIASKAAKLKTEINKKLINKAYVGIIKSKSDTTITIASREGAKIVNINQDTLYEPKLTKKAPLKDEDSIIALGDVDETSVLTARKIVKLSETNNQPKKTYLFGEVLTVSDNLLTIKDKESKNIAVSTLKITTSVRMGQFIIATGVFNKNNILEAKFIYITKGEVKAKPKEATKSATPSPKP